MAHTKAKGTTKLGRDSKSKRLGLKVSSGQMVISGRILVRQRGTKYHPGDNVLRGKDDTLFARSAGVVRFEQRISNAFTGKRIPRTFVSVLPEKLRKERSSHRVKAS